MNVPFSTHMKIGSYPIDITIRCQKIFGSNEAYQIEFEKMRKEYCVHSLNSEEPEISRERFESFANLMTGILHIHTCAVP